MKPSVGIHIQEPYIRHRDNPYFDGLLRGDITSRRRSSTDNFQESDENRTSLRTTSDIIHATSKDFVLDKSGTSMDLPLEESPPDIVLNLICQPSVGSLSKISNEDTLELGGTHESTTESSPKTTNANEEYQIVASQSARPVMEEKSYSMKQRKENLSNIPLPQSAATFYNGLSPQVEIVESWESIKRLNLYLAARRDDVRSGVPGKFLHAVISQDVSDVGSLASTITYAFYLNEILESDQLCIVPVINMYRADLSSHGELKWLLDSCQINESSLISVDEIDLSYYDLFGSLKLVLLNGDKLPKKQEALKGALVEIFNCRKDESVFPEVQKVTVGEDSSCCTLIAEKLALTSPEMLSEQGFSRLLLAGILMDTENLSAPHCTTKDKYMATLLINGAGRFGSTGLYQLLRYKMHDISNLKVVDILRKDYKKWTRTGKPDGAGPKSLLWNIGMSSVGLSMEQLLSHEDGAAEEIKHFQKLEKLRLLIIVSGYNDSKNNFKREILVAAESMDLMKNLLLFLNSNACHLPLKVLPLPGLKGEMRVFGIDKITSRKTIERLLEEFGGASKG